MLKKLPSHKINVEKNAYFFLWWAPTHYNFTFNLQFLHELKHIFFSLKLSGGFSIFNPVSFLLKFILLFNKKHLLSFKIKMIEKPHTVLLPDLWFLSYNKKFENSMISAWVGAPQKTDMETNFLMFENRSLSTSLFLNSTF